MKTLFSFLILIFVVGCSDASVASQNLSVAEDNFEIVRRIVFYDAIQGEYLLLIEGRCSIKAYTRVSQLEVTCKTGAESHKKHFLGVSDNVTYFAQQLESASVNAYRYRILFNPAEILPDVELNTAEKAREQRTERIGE